MINNTLKNSLLLQALNQEDVVRPPVWMMRQAGRYLPEFRRLRNQYDFFTRCRTPEIAAEITVQPVDILGVDAAILFSDILVVPQAMNIPFVMKEGVGPFLEYPIRKAKDVSEVQIPDVEEALSYVFDAIKITKEKLENRVPLIGFAGSPWTIFCYAVEGKGSKSFDKAKQFCFSEPMLAHQLLQKITETTIAYLRRQILAGVDVIQIFDSWGGMLSPEDYQVFSYTYIEKIIQALSKETHLIVFAKGCWYALDKMSRSGVSALGVDWTCSAEYARKVTENRVTLQGNFDPARLYSSIPEIKQQVRTMIKQFGKDKYIVNLGHGILPDIPVSHAQAFVDAVKEFLYKN